MALKAPRPTGTVTLLFTDIEGSTQHWEQQRAAMPDALRRHDELLRAAIEAHSDGTVFSLNPATGVETVLHAFDGSDGANPWVGLLDVSGTLYGTAQGGGTNSDGTIFKLIPPTKVRPIAFAVVHDFVPAEGARPRAPLTNFDNELYGTTSFGGASDKGAMYNISLQGALGETHSFAGGPGDGSQPWAGVLLMDGTLYGTTLKGGLYRKGAIFLCEFC